MSDAKTQIESLRKWVVEHKLRTVGIFPNQSFPSFIFSFRSFFFFNNYFFFRSGCLWLSGITGSIAYNWSRPNMKTSVKIIHARYYYCFLYILSGFIMPIKFCNLYFFASRVFDSSINLSKYIASNP